MGNTHDLRMANATVNDEAAALAALAENGYIRIYDGSRPATANTAIGSQVKLAELRFGAPAFGAPVNGVITANAITPDISADATGTASWFRVLEDDGTTPLWDGEAGTAGADLILNSVAIGAGSQVSITSLVHTVPKQ